MASDKIILEFEKWWQDIGSKAPTDDVKQLLRSTWDSAIISAVKILSDEKDGLVREGKYEYAAMARDIQLMLESALSDPAKWKLLQDIPWRARQIAWHREKLRKLSDEDLEKLVPPVMNCEFSVAMEEVKKERKAAREKKPPESC